MPEPLTITGPAGRLEVAWRQPSEAATALAIVCHPHPLYGGNMDNKVVTSLQRAASDAGLAALRFNFRGIGASDGHFDHGVGEIEDAQAVLDWALAQTGLARFVLMGFSFGGLIAARLALRRRPAQLVTVAPALYALGDDDHLAPGCPWLLIHGRDDDVVDCEQTLQKIQDLQPPVDVRLLDGVGHFYHGRLTDLREIVTPVLHALG